MDIIGKIYGLFEGLYGHNLSEHLWGWDVTALQYAKTNLYNESAGYIVIIALAFFLLYYYVINHPRFNRLWSWALVLVAVMSLNVFIGWNLTYSDLAIGNISEDIVANITENDCLMFGLVNGLISGVVFFLLSIGFKHWSANCKYSPF